MSAEPSGEEDIPLPRLRKSLLLEVIASEASDLPALVISDAVSGKYYKLEWPMSGAFLLWGDAASATELIALAEQHYSLALGVDDIKQAIAFVYNHELGETDEKGGWQRYRQLAEARKQSIVKQIMHHYLFFRIPLLHPDPMLKALLPYMRAVFAWPFWCLVGLVAALGLYLTTRQWADLSLAFYDALQFQQLTLFAMSLLLLKAVHELGHAVAAAHFGCRVPSMGIAFMIGTPVLYTDTSDSWRLAARRQRLIIVFAGVAAESVIAAIALVLWPLLPEGYARDICFSFATAAIAMSLAVNLNPMMRFDGYFALSDYLRIPNLQARAFALAVWRLREVLFGLGESPPEDFPAHTRRILIVYSYATWIYRLFLFLGIALMLYMVMGKTIGIPLGLFEIVVFILRPLWSEARKWWSFRGRIRKCGRAALTAGALGASLILLCSPIVRTVESPGVLVAAEEQELHLPRAARLETIAAKEGDFVGEGQILFKAVSPELDQQIIAARLKLRLAALRLRRLAASQIEQEQTIVLEHEHAQAREMLDGLLREKQSLTIRSPFAGRLIDTDVALGGGMWLAREHLLGRIVGRNGARVKAIVSDSDLGRIGAGARGTFIADEAEEASRDVVITTIAPAGNGQLPEPALADRFGGPVAALDAGPMLLARDGWVDVTFETRSSEPPSRLIRGIVRISAEPVSPLRIVWRRIGSVLAREQGF